MAAGRSIDGGDFDLSASVKAYFALKLLGDDPEAPHMRAGPRGDPGARRRARCQCVHPDHAGAVRPGAVAGGAGHAGRDHAAAALVPVPPRQGVLLVAHRHRAARDADGAASRAPATRAASGSAELFVDAARGRARLHRQPDRLGLGQLFLAVDRLLRLAEPHFPSRCAAARDREGGRLHHRAAERRGRARRGSFRRWPMR